MPKYFLAFATNFKNENPYLAEWIEYHRLVGVDHFFLYDQDGGQEAQRILSPYEAAGIVTRHPWTHLDGTRFDGPTRFYQKNKNHLAFAHCARNYRDQCRWLMKIDVDEFLFPPEADSTLVPSLKRFCRPGIKGLRLPRYDFGPNGHLHRPAQLVIEAYTRREAAPSNHKDMGGGPYLSRNAYCYSAHWWRYRLLRPGRLVRPRDGLRINHYYTKSLAEHLDRQNVSRGRKNNEADFRIINERANAVEDRGMLRFSEKVRAALARRGRLPGYMATAAAAAGLVDRRPREAG